MSVELALITPMYNEASSIGKNIQKALQALTAVNVSWEYILVDDGSTDDSYSIAKEVLAERANCHIIHYTPNRGRGYALRQGFALAKGRYVITTESDLSWGADIIPALYHALIQDGGDIVVASTHLAGGGYENVPLFRRMLSFFGNQILRRCFDGNLTMLSGMTRGYRREVIESIHLEEDEKEIHLEIIAKAQLLGYRISEIPGRIKWTRERASESSRKHLGIIKYVIPHLLSSIAEGGFKLIVGLSSFCFLVGIGLVAFGTLNKLFVITELPKPNIVTYGLLFIMFATMSFLVAVLSLQLLNIKKHIVHVQSQLKKIQTGYDKEARSR
jgi:glycosyltransferase involved in cell wall biosynthesis